MIIGREKELKLFDDVLRDDQSHFIAVYGRRRVGKTFLVRHAYKDRFTFEHVGLYGSGMKEQLEAFHLSLKHAGYISKDIPKNWLEAFECLRELIERSTEKKKIIFIDELSWMDTQKSRFLPALEHFFNSFVSVRDDVVLIVCASATSWMLSKVIHNKGGLYNRLTRQINLKNFNLAECEEYVRAAGLSLTRSQILEYYMIFGGVPYYWGFLEKGKSLAQNIDDILFAADAPLKDEYRYLYSSIFKNPEGYLKVIETLGQKKAGMTRNEIISGAKLPNSGSVSIKLDELESCGFIRAFRTYGAKSKGCVYQLVDCFTLFYCKFLKNKPQDPHFWSNQINTPMINVWRGLAFERVCLLHIDQIKQKLGIPGVLTDVNSWHCKADPDKGVFGSQIDLLIVRKDQVVNLCEMKYSDSEYIVLEKFVKDMKRKMSDFKNMTGIRYAIFPTLITPYGVVDNSYAGELQALVIMDDLFLKGNR